MNDKYLHKTIEEIASEKEFIDWVLHEKHDDIMDSFLTLYPDQLDKINEATYLVNAVHFAETKPISDTKIKKLWNRIEDSIEENTSPNEDDSIVRKINFMPWLVAASMIGVLASAFLFFSHNETQFEAKFAQKVEKTLPDNSKLWINAGSSIVFDDNFKGKDRKVKLIGEAQFQVTKGIGKFVVETDNATVTVLGTKFNVRERDNTFVLECFEGKVQVNVGNTKEIVTGGNAISYNFKTKKSKKYTVVKDANAGWINGEFQFVATPLSAVIHELERQFDIKIDFQGDFSQAQYSGFFKSDQLENALQSVFWPMKKKFKIEEKHVSVY